MSAKPLNEKAIFKVACSIESVDSRNEYLNQVCGGDQLLLERISTLLRMREEEPDFLAPQASPARTLDVAPIAVQEKPGMKIGRYKLVHEIGHGGMGVVYMAVQKEPVKRKVALKITHAGISGDNNSEGLAKRAFRQTVKSVRAIIFGRKTDEQAIRYSGGDRGTAACVASWITS